MNIVRHFSRIGENICYYKILNVSPTATNEEIKFAYYALAKKLHPDSNSLSTSNQKELFLRVSEAYTILSDSTKRAEYNKSIHVEIKTQTKYDELFKYFYGTLKKRESIEDYFDSMSHHKEKYKDRFKNTMLNTKEYTLHIHTYSSYTYFIFI